MKTAKLLIVGKTALLRGFSHGTLQGRQSDQEAEHCPIAARRAGFDWHLMHRKTTLMSVVRSTEMLALLFGQ
jgi:hypothetical protein